MTKRNETVRINGRLVPLNPPNLTGIKIIIAVVTLVVGLWLVNVTLDRVFPPYGASSVNGTKTCVECPGITVDSRTGKVVPTPRLDNWFGFLK